MYNVRRLCVSYRMNVRTTQKMLGVHRYMLSVISNIDYHILYFFKLPSKTIICLAYFLVNYRISIISLLFRVSIPNPGLILETQFEK